VSDALSFPFPTPADGPEPVTLSSESNGLDIEADNLHLAFYRLVPKGVRDDAQDDTSRKQKYLEALADHSDDGNAAAPVEEYVDRLDAQLEGLAAAGHRTETLELETEGRLIAGLGYDSPLEVGCTLHPLYGFPYLPGSSVKGVARAYAEDVAKADEDDLYAVFGSTSKREQDARTRRGRVCFFDAVPTRAPRLEVDVLTPHYTDYYTASDDPPPPGEWNEPQPVPFLTVAPRTPFRFPLASQDPTCLEQAADWLKQGLFWLGGGGRTSAGYGLFTDEQRREQEEQRRKRRRLAERLPDKREQIGKNSTGVLARVLGPSRYDQYGVPEAKLDVELHVEEYEGMRVPMTGSAINVERFEADWVKVRVDEFFGRDDNIPLVRYEGKWRP